MADQFLIPSLSFIVVVFDCVRTWTSQWKDPICLSFHLFTHVQFNLTGLGVWYLARYCKTFLIWRWLIAGEPGVNDWDQWRLPEISCPGWRRSILVHGTWYSWWWQVRRECSVDAVNEKPLGKATEAKWICVCMHVCCLGVVQVLKRSVTWSTCAIEIISMPVLGSNTGVYLPLCPQKFPEEVCSFDPNTWRAAMIDPSLSGPVGEALIQWLCCVAFSWVAPCVSRKPSLHVLSGSPTPSAKKCILNVCPAPVTDVVHLWDFMYLYLSFFTMVKDNACTRGNYASLKQDLALSLWLWLRLYNDDGLLSFTAPLLSSAPLHLSPSLSFFPRPVKIHTGIQPCGKSDKTSVELHRLGGMYVANDFQRLMTRKEVENWGGGERKMKASRGRSSRRAEEERGEKNPWTEHAVLNVQTSVEVIN